MLKTFRRALGLESLCHREGVHALGAFNVAHFVQLILPQTALRLPVELPVVQGWRTKAAFVLPRRDPGDSVPCQRAETFRQKKGSWLQSS